MTFSEQTSSEMLAFSQLDWYYWNLFLTPNAFVKLSFISITPSIDAFNCFSAYIVWFTKILMSRLLIIGAYHCWEALMFQVQSLV